MRCPNCDGNIKLHVIRSRFKCPHCDAILHAKNINLAIYLPTIILAFLPVFIPLPKEWHFFIPVVIVFVVLVYYLAVKILIGLTIDSPHS